MISASFSRLRRLHGAIRATGWAAGVLVSVLPASTRAQASVPPADTTGAVAVNAPLKTPAAPAITPRASWTADRRDFVIGDIITVLIDDYTISTAVKENVATDSRTRGLSVSARIPEWSKNAGLDSRNTADQAQRGSARRENRFQNEMSVRVVGVGEGGLLQVKGTKTIDVDKSKQNIVFTGWVRAQDVSVSNLIESSRVADLQIGYVSPGPLGKPKQGIISRVLGVFWP